MTVTDPLGGIRRRYTPCLVGLIQLIKRRSPRKQQKKKHKQTTLMSSEQWFQFDHYDYFLV